MGPEGKLQARVIKTLQKEGWYVNKLVISKAGWPDIIALKIVVGGLDGWPTRTPKTIFIECKAPGKKPTPLQEVVHEQIRKHGGTIWVIDDYDDFKTKISLWQ